MKISEMIKNLQQFMEEHGDLECWYAKDDEGNGYQEIYYKPSLYYVDEDGEVHQSLEEFGIDEEDVEDYWIAPICIVN